MPSERTSSIDLYWIPLGAGGRSVRFNGRVFEAIAAARHRRPRCDLYHAALIVHVDGERYTIELAPAWGADAASGGVVCTGAVGSHRLGRWRLFRYELRCWPGGSIPDLGYAVGGATRLSEDPAVTRLLLGSVAEVPAPVWGRDELHAGEMWNSNSVIAWLLARAGIPTDALGPPPHGRAPGWQAGVTVARRPGMQAEPSPANSFGCEPEPRDEAPHRNRAHPATTLADAHVTSARDTSSSGQPASCG